MPSAVKVTFLSVAEAVWKPSLSGFTRLTSTPPGSLHRPSPPCCVQASNSVLADHRLPTAQEVTVLSVCP